MPTQPIPATDSAAELHKLIGDDATATFENDPTFVDSNPTGSASSENLEEQRPGAGEEFRAAPPAGKGAGPDPDEEDEFEDDEEEDDDEDDEDLDDEDLDDAEDEDDLDDEDEDDDLDDEDDEDDEEEEDDADELKASASSSAPLRADGLLGYEDEAEDADKHVDRVAGDAERKREEARKLTDDPDENPYDAYTDVDPEAAREGEVESNVVIRPVKPMDLNASSAAA